MIVERHVQDTPGFAYRTRDLAIFAAGGGIAGRVVVGDDQAGRGAGERRLEDLARMHDRGVERSHRDHDLTDQLVARVQAQREEALALAIPKLEGEMPPDRAWGGEGRLSLTSLLL